jgi:hypothetical protein
LDNHLDKFLLSNNFLYLVSSLESYSRLPFLASEKSRIENGYIWIII